MMKIKVEIMRKKKNIRIIRRSQLESQNYEMMSTFHHGNLSFHLILLSLTSRNGFPYKSIYCQAYYHSLLAVRHTIEHL